MSDIEVSRPLMQDLRKHLHCELQLEESPFKDGNLVLKCLDHDEFILTVRELK